MGPHCGFECPKGKEGEVCSGKGECEADMTSDRAVCKCDGAFSGDACADYACGTALSELVGEKCQCPADSEKCCSREDALKAAAFDKFVAAHKEMLRSGKKELDMTKLDLSEVLTLDEV